MLRILYIVAVFLLEPIMQDRPGTKKELLRELAELRERNQELERKLAASGQAEKSMNEDALTRSLERLSIISDTASQLLMARSPQSIVEALCKRVMDYLDCHAFFNYLVDHERNCLALNAYAGIPENIAREIHFLDYGVAVCGTAARDGCRIIAENIPTTPDARCELVRSFGIKAYACHPIMARGQVLGTLSFGTRSRLQFSEDDISLMKIVSDQVANAMDRIHLLRSAQEHGEELEIRVMERTAELRRQAELLDLAHDAIIVHDMDERILFWNSGAEDTFGFIRNEAVGRKISRLLKREFPGPASDLMSIVREQGHWEGELLHTRKDGRHVISHSRWVLRRGHSKTSEIMQVNRDVTSRKRAEEAVKMERERFYTVLETLPVYVTLMTPDYKIPFANRVFRKSFGEPYGKRCFEHLFGRSEPCEDCGTYNVLKTGKPLQWQWTGPDEHTYQVFDYPFIDTDGTPLILEMGIDITDRKHAEDEVRFANAYNRSLIEASLDSLVAVDAGGRITDVSAATEMITGYPRHELIGTDFSDYFTDPGRARAGYQKVFKEGAVRDYALEIRHRDGHLTPVLYNASTYKDETDKVKGVIAVARDISYHRKMETALRDSEERYRTAIEKAFDGIALVKEDKHIYVNPRFAEIFGYDNPAEIIGRPLSLTVHPDDLDMVSTFNRMRQNGESPPARYDIRGVKKDGALRYINVSAVKTDYLGESVSLVYLRDITDYKNLEDQLRQSQKMEAIGTLAGGVAHDFNNILGAIIGFSEMIEEDLPESDPSAANIRKVLSAAGRGRDLVKQILTFSRKTEYARSPLCIAPLIKETVQFLRASIPTTVAIDLKIRALHDSVVASPVEIQQIVMNLATNAAYAMRHTGGSLAIDIQNIVLDHDLRGFSSGMSPGRYVRLAVTDTGEGIGPEVIDRVFDPFFTTKAVGEGSGMGLAVIYGIVKSLNGYISVDSEQSTGSTFQVLLPASQSGEISETNDPYKTKKGSGHILFIDDEELLVEWGKATLERLGYTVSAVTESAEALKLFSSNPSRFDLVITDQTMPDMTGMQLAEGLLNIRPAIPIILCTGHSDSVLPEKVKEAGIKAFLYKPIGRQELSDIIQRLLDNIPERSQ